MFKKITIALIASALMGTPVFAQSTMRTQNGAPATAVTINHAKPAVKTHTVKVKKHKVKKVKIARHVKHAKHAVIVKHGKHVATTKPTMPTRHN